jgi:hypothetical protein
VTPFVVWRAAAGSYRDVRSGRSVKLPHDAIVREKIEATSTLY